MSKTILLVDKAFKPIRMISFQEAAKKLYTQKASYVIEPDVLQLKHRIVPFDLPMNCSKKAILMRDDYICQYCGIKCGKHGATVDHIIPESRGGEFSFTNCVTACENCNIVKKKNRTPDEAGMRLMRQPIQPTYFSLLRLHGGENILEKFEAWMNAACGIAA
jgi:hypothetical protein